MILFFYSMLLFLRNSNINYSNNMNSTIKNLKAVQTGGLYFIHISNCSLMLSFSYHSRSPTDVCALHFSTQECPDSKVVFMAPTRSMWNLISNSFQCHSLLDHWGTIFPYLQIELIRFLKKYCDIKIQFLSFKTQLQHKDTLLHQFIPLILFSLFNGSVCLLMQTESLSMSQTVLGS